MTYEEIEVAMAEDPDLAARSMNRLFIRLELQAVLAEAFTETATVIMEIPDAFNRSIGSRIAKLMNSEAHA